MQCWSASNLVSESCCSIPFDRSKNVGLAVVSGAGARYVPLLTKLVSARPMSAN